MKPLINVTSFAQFGNIEVERWFQFRAAPAFQLIIDHELQDRHATLNEVLLHYPTITTYSIVMNPWAKAKFLYNNMIQCKFGPYKYVDFDCGVDAHFDTSSFENFVMNWPSVQLLGSTASTTTQQVEFITDSNQKTVDFLLHAEIIVIDFIQIQQYANCDVSFHLRESEYPTYYRDAYTNEMKLKINTLFNDDVKHLNYQF